MFFGVYILKTYFHYESYFSYLISIKKRLVSLLYI